MPYILKYTSIDAIARRLRGRVNVVTTTTTGQLNNAISGTVDSLLIEQVAEQIESKLEIGLGQIYCLPIPYTATTARSIISGIAEKLIVSEIALTHFKMQVNPETGADMGFGNALRKQAFEDVELILGGHGIYVPGIMARPANNPAVTEAKQPTVLPGVKLIPSNEQPDTYTRNYSCVEKRELPEEQQLWG